MKRILLCTALFLSLLACKKEQTTTTISTEIAEDSVTTTKPTAGASPENASFDVNTIPVSDKDLGKFPYLNAPDTYKYGYGDDGIKPGEISDFDKEYFAVNGRLILQEGKTCKVRIEKKQGTGSFNSLVVGESYKKAILALGGVQVNNVPVPKSEIDRIGDKELIDKKYGHSIDYNLLDDVKTFVIRTKDKIVWIQFSLLNSGSGNITILEKSV